MPELKDKKILRILDANLNRAKEGLRVCEDICRFVFDHKGLTVRYKQIRHQLTDISKRWDVSQTIQGRDVRHDIGRPAAFEGFRRTSIDDIFYANSQRVKESIRVLEELAKLSAQRSAQDFKALRYKLYALEQQALKKF